MGLTSRLMSYFCLQWISEGRQNHLKKPLKPTHSTNDPQRNQHKTLKKITKTSTGRLRLEGRCRRRVSEKFHYCLDIDRYICVRRHFLQNLAGTGPKIHF